MNNKMDDEVWETVEYSKKEIDRAGKAIVNEYTVKMDNGMALTILNNWRSSHTFPLFAITKTLKRKNPNALIVQRLKRLDSIIAKLKRNSTMSLYRMQDLGGCRIILDTVEEVYKVVNDIKETTNNHIFRKENDYILQPKLSGYRCYHLIYQYHSEMDETYNKNILIEIQVRTKLQHTWATAVEIMGIYTKSELKASKGEDDILRFFILLSSVFSHMEKTPLVPNTPLNIDDTINEIKEIDTRHNLVSILSAFSVVTNYVESTKDGYYLLILNYETKRLNTKYFDVKEIEVATNAYNEIEKCGNKKLDVVLVRANSFAALKEAYPNYFYDIEEFVAMMRRILA